MAWDANTSTTTQLDAGIATLYSKLIIYAATPELVADQVANVREEFMAKTISYTKYSNLTLISSALTEANDATSVQPTDAAVTLTPVEYGNVVTRTLLAQIQNQGIVDTGVAFLIGRNLGASSDGLAIAALDAFGGTTIYPNAATAAGEVGVNDVMDKTFANRGYNKLARANVPGFAGFYIGIAHDDVLHDLRVDTVNGGWTDVSKYADASSVLRNEVGMYAGVRWLRSGNATVTSDGAAGTVDLYKTNVCGFNSLGKAVSIPPQVRITGPFDKLGQFRPLLRVGRKLGELMEPLARFGRAIMSQATQKAQAVAWKVQRLSREDGLLINGYKRPALCLLSRRQCGVMI